MTNIHEVLLIFFREITKMKQDKGGGVASVEADDDFQVVPVEKISKSHENFAHCFI